MFITITVISILAAVAAGLWFFRQRSRNQANNATVTSIVTLLSEPRGLNADALAQLFAKIVGRPVRGVNVLSDEGGPSDDQPIGESVFSILPGQFMAGIGDATFLINNVPVPYVDDPTITSGTFPELRLRKAFADHKAWFSVDVMGSDLARLEAIPIAAKLVAELIGADCLALYYVPLNKWVPCFIEETVAALKTADPIRAVFEEFTHMPVIPIDDDPRLKAAEAEARRRFPEFEKAFLDNEGEGFSVKTLLTRGGNSEHIWIDVESIENGKVRGLLGNEPVDLDGLRIGSRVEIGSSEVEDWAFERNGEPAGMFTVPVIQQILEEKG